jgi:antitoxin ParD1/3/4
MPGWLPQEREERRRQFQAMLREAEDEADRDGTLTLESVLAEVDALFGERPERE